LCAGLSICAPARTGRRILFTAPRQYASRLSSLLIQSGAHPVWLPAIEITQLSDNTELDAALLQLSEYTHVAYTSRNGINAVLQRLELLHDGAERAQEAVSRSGARFCALGKDGAALLEAGYPCDVLPTEPSTQGLVKELVERGEAQDARIIIPRFVEALEAAGAHAIRVEAYATAYGCYGDIGNVEIRQLLAGEIDAVVFSSTAESEALAQAAGGLERLRKVITATGTLLAAHGPYTAKGAGAVLGLDIPCVSKRFGTFEGVVEALEEVFASRN